MKRIIILLTVSLATPQMHLAAAADGSPREAIEKALDAMNHGRTSEFVQAVHPDDLKEFRASVLDVVNLAVENGQAEEVLAVFHGVKNADELKKLDAAAMFTAMISKVTSDPEARQVLAGMRVEVIGTLPAGKDKAYVVYRTKMQIGDTAIERLTTTGVRKSGDDWKMLLDDVAGEMAVLKARLADDSKLPDVAATRFEPLGHVMDGKDAAMVVYRMETPMGDVVLAKMGVVKAAPSDPQWTAVLKDEKGPVQELIKSKSPLPRLPRPE
ncbi:hypothetical protein [Paludisphaera rhizosphaerae]|uniref:hypothetical protein n=1 Tax=Paludisphaera rhizosphaerae TaxID=2711216 RepID=UPI0013EA2BA6|nr:hypothetical protein [Paludisphaera rhizosphaerae]